MRGKIETPRGIFTTRGLVRRRTREALQRFGVLPKPEASTSLDDYIQKFFPKGFDQLFIRRLSFETGILGRLVDSSNLAERYEVDEKAGVPSTNLELKEYRDRKHRSSSYLVALEETISMSEVSKQEYQKVYSSYIFQHEMRTNSPRQNLKKLIIPELVPEMVQLGKTGGLALAVTVSDSDVKKINEDREKLNITEGDLTVREAIDMNFLESLEGIYRRLDIGSEWI